MLMRTISIVVGTAAAMMIMLYLSEKVVQDTIMCMKVVMNERLQFENEERCKKGHL